MAPAGGDPFADIQVPQAAIALKQGFGRLIRRRDDRGIVAILDGRIVTRTYGRVFLDTLPNGPIDPQLLYKNCRAHAERAFSERYDTWEEHNRRDPTHLVICGEQTEIRGDAFIEQVALLLVVSVKGEFQAASETLLYAGIRFTVAGLLTWSTTFSRLVVAKPFAVTVIT